MDRARHVTAEQRAMLREAMGAVAPRAPGWFTVSEVSEATGKSWTQARVRLLALIEGGAWEACRAKVGTRAVTVYRPKGAANAKRAARRR